MQLPRGRRAESVWQLYTASPERGAPLADRGSEASSVIGDLDVSGPYPPDVPLAEVVHVARDVIAPRGIGNEALPKQALPWGSVFAPQPKNAAHDFSAVLTSRLQQDPRFTAQWVAARRAQQHAARPKGHDHFERARRHEIEARQRVQAAVLSDTVSRLARDCIANGVGQTNSRKGR